MRQFLYLLAYWEGHTQFENYFCRNCEAECDSPLCTRTQCWQTTRSSVWESEGCLSVRLRQHFDWVYVRLHTTTVSCITEIHDNCLVYHGDPRQLSRVSRRSWSACHIIYSCDGAVVTVTWSRWRKQKWKCIIPSVSKKGVRVFLPKLVCVYFICGNL